LIGIGEGSEGVSSRPDIATISAGASSRWSTSEQVNPGRPTKPPLLVTGIRSSL
jgi:hypothetical protein